MQLQLLITADADTIARVLAVVGNSPTASTTGTTSPGAASPVGSTAPTPIAPAPLALPPQTSNDDDETGDVAPTGSLDKDGLPWDERIHSNPAKQTAKGLWRKRRGVDDALITSVEAELKARANLPAPSVTDQQWEAAAPPQPVTPPPAPIAAPVTPPPAPLAAPPAIPTMPPIAPPADVSQVPPAPTTIPALPPVPAAPEPAPAPTPPATPAALDFTGFMAHIAAKVGVPGPNGAPMIDTDYLNQRVAEINGAWAGQPGFTALTVITDIAASPIAAQLVAYAKSLFERDGRW